MNAHLAVASLYLLNSSTTARCMLCCKVGT